MTDNIIIAGFGGQGVLLLGQFIAYSAIKEGKEVTWLPSYGPEMRGGTANCSVVVSSEPVASPIITHPDMFVVMNRPSLFKFIDSVQKGGTVLVNSSLIPDKVERTDITVKYIDANKLAHSIGNDRAANLILFGAYCGARKELISKQSAIRAIEEKFAKKPQFIASNVEAFELGYIQ